MQIKTIGSGSSGNGYFVSDGYTQILLEAGIKFDKVQKALDFKTRKVSACFITHNHLDHAKYTEDYLKHGLACYTTAGTSQALGLQHHRLKMIEYKKVVRVGSLRILPFDTQHDVAEPCGYLIQSDNGSKLLFATDTYLIKYRFPGLTHMLLEVNHDYDYMMERVESGALHKALANRIMKSHLNLENAIKYLQASDLSQLKEIHLIHISKDNGLKNRFKDEIQKVTGVPVKIAGD
ncbi:MBL fold metallo-hydrolase [Salinicoccus sp. HZC-1]|uniref:MBL fold metallo-hydrolase n=1 Tax=Salinicoccus sp. HZC-1 TaxID=3385497 RepID=UPI00398B74F7